MTPEEIALAGLMKRTKDALADLIIELTRICKKETERADRAEAELKANLKSEFEGCSSDIFNDSIPAQQNQNNPRPTTTN